ncbi:MBL fold metallo-hydrolase [Falsibacillus albus]|uniref:MBL fold metallo-hydrolase n=1 Tax=Falsibacillus albus TaxID=2478915 RepID=A0A3L7JRP7_9BACI|nr:MBL fold metallo-hydrolase [Falsibacillus albus]RLQ93346.1 MBL fold metallo-hydrolase [Falsibacillus albus]
MEKWICCTCGTQFGEMDGQPEACPICEDERQYVKEAGQAWTSLNTLIRSGQLKNDILQEERGIYSITTKPGFAIGQTAYLIQTEAGNVLWDCITYLDEETIAKVQELGGINAIALSHPHYYSSQVEWAEAFGCPVYIHEDDSQWVMRNSENIRFWSGEHHELFGGITLSRLGGHFKGGAVLNWEAGKNGKGILFSGDIIQVVADRNWVSFMYSYPNSIPLPSKKVREIQQKISSIDFDRLYGAFHRIIRDDAKISVINSAQRYISALEGTLFET